MADQASQGLFSPGLQRVRIRAALPHITGDVLDIGCGNGALAAFVPANRYYGYDRSIDVIGKAVRRFPGHKFSTELPGEIHFDTVVALAVIEHVKDPADTLREWSLYLRDGGYIVITTPHKSFGWTHEVGSKLGLFSRDAAEEHETMFDRTDLNAVAKKANLISFSYKRFLFGSNQLCLMKK